MDLRWDAMTIDCRDPHALARFYCDLLGVEVRGTWEQYVGLHPMSPGQPRLVLQGTDDPRPPKNTAHLDLHVPSLAELPTAVQRAVSLGARVVSEHDEEVGTGPPSPTPRGTCSAWWPTESRRPIHLST